jgi:glycosyltransferase involved in cell wall biosynthesis
VTAGDGARAAACDVSVVVIGRNEGERLVRCLASIAAAHWDMARHEVIYVDSNSTDGSAARAAAAGARALVLDDASPCAAKARNLGWRAARGEFVLFLDGDTVLHPGFVARALDTLRDGRLCAAWGHRRESDPGQSLYTRVLDLDWVYPVGHTRIDVVPELGRNSLDGLWRPRHQLVDDRVEVAHAAVVCCLHEVHAADFTPAVVPILSPHGHGHAKLLRR